MVRFSQYIAEASYHAAKVMQQKVKDKIKPEFHGKYDFKKITNAHVMLNTLNRAKLYNHLKEEHIVEARVQKTQEVNGQTFQFDYHQKPTPSQQAKLKDIMIPYVAMYTKDGYDVILRSEKHVGLDSQFVLFRKKNGRSEVMVDKLISKNGKTKDTQ